MRRPLCHGRTILCRRVAGAHKRANRDTAYATGFEILLNAVQRLLQVDLNIVAESFQRRDIHDVSFIREISARRLPNQIVNRREKGRERLA